MELLGANRPRRYRHILVTRSQDWNKNGLSPEENAMLAASNAAAKLPTIYSQSHDFAMDLVISE